MSLHDFLCCQGDAASHDCNDCPMSPKYLTRHDIELEHKRRAAGCAAREMAAKRILAEGAQSALTMVEVGLLKGLSAEDAIRVAREGLDVWGPDSGAAA